MLTKVLTQWLLLGCLVLGFALGIGFQHARVASLKAEHAKYQLSVQQATTTAYKALLTYQEAVQKQLALSRNQYDEDTKKLSADLVSANAARDSLIERLRKLTSRKPTTDKQTEDIGDLGEGDKNRRTFDLFLHLFDRHSAELIAIGNYADKLKAAGLKCERDMDAWIQQSPTTSPTSPQYNVTN